MIDILKLRGGGKKVKKSAIFIVILAALLILSFANPKQANAGGNGWAVLGGVLGGLVLGEILLGPHDRIIVGPVYPAYPPPVIYYPPPPVVYYPPPVVYQTRPVWISDHYEWRPALICRSYQPCYYEQRQFFIPGHWE